MKIMDLLSTTAFKPSFNFTSLISNPLLGGKSVNTLEDFYGLYVACSKDEINFYVLAPHQYFLIFSISSKLGLFHPLTAKTLFEEEGDNKKSGIRRVLFQENDISNYNVGVKSGDKQKIGEIAIFDIYVKKELFAFGDSNGNVAVYKFHKHYVDDSQDKVITIDHLVSSDENEMTFSGAIDVIKDSFATD